jgi:hypothetical protein
VQLASNTDANKGLTMNSGNLQNGLVFDDRDRSTMEKQTKDVYPNYMFKFNPNHQKGFSYTNSMTSEILALFKPT